MTEQIPPKSRAFTTLAIAFFYLAALTGCQQLENGSFGSFGTFGSSESSSSEDELPVSETSPESPAPEAPAGLKIGAVLPYTGDLARVGQPMIEVLPLIVDQVNACGGVNDESISLVVEDDQSQPETAAAAMTKLVEVDDIDVAIVGFVSSSTPRILDVAIENSIPIVSSATTSPVFTERAKQGAFQGFWARTVPSDVHRARALAKLAIDRRYRNVSTVVVNNDDGISFEQAFTANFEKLGGTVVNKDAPTRYDPQAETMGYAALDTFFPYGGNPDAVIASLDNKGGAVFLRSAYDLGVANSAQIILANSIQPRSLLETVGKTSDGKYILSGMLGMLPGATGPALSNFTTLWKQRDGRTTPGVFVTQTWDAVALLVLAAQAADSYEGDAIKEQLQTVANAPGIEVTSVCAGLKLLSSGQDIDYQGVSGNVDLDENGDVIGNYDVWAVDEQGKVEVINQIKLDR